MNDLIAYYLFRLFPPIIVAFALLALYIDSRNKRAIQSSASVLLPFHLFFVVPSPQGRILSFYHFSFSS